MLVMQTTRLLDDKDAPTISLIMFALNVGIQTFFLFLKIVSNEENKTKFQRFKNIYYTKYVKFKNIQNLVKNVYEVQPVGDVAKFTRNFTKLT